MKIKLKNNPPKENIDLTENIEEVKIISNLSLGDEILKVEEPKEVPVVVKKDKHLIKEEVKKALASKEDVADETDKMIEKVQQTAIVHTIKNNEEVQKRVLESAEEQVMSSIEIKRNEQALKVVKATYNANKDACENLGLSDEGRPMWQIRVAKVINNFWFIVWAMVSSVTLTPIIFFLKRIGTQVRSVRLTWILTLLFYALIIGGVVLGIMALSGVFRN